MWRILLFQYQKRHKNYRFPSGFGVILHDITIYWISSYMFDLTTVWHAFMIQCKLTAFINQVLQWIFWLSVDMED